ncbi:MAG: hypothetical protein D4S01_09225 [Dehalococcoidia bacterium]|nr:MAG: hypothetical protein D4S01_09225 [Dehalococcoidia bacterium]
MFGLILLTNEKVLASGFHISSIGGVDTGGQMLSQWWNTSLQPTFRGESLPGADILVDIDGSSVSIAADSAGDWVYTPAAELTSGDHTVSFTSNESDINFTLTLGTDSVDWTAVGSGASETLPAVGIFLPTIVLTGVGSGLVLLAKKFKNRNL